MALKSSLPFVKPNFRGKLYPGSLITSHQHFCSFTIIQKFRSRIIFCVPAERLQKKLKQFLEKQSHLFSDSKVSLFVSILLNFLFLESMSILLLWAVKHAVAPFCTSSICKRVQPKFKESGDSAKWSAIYAREHKCYSRFPLPASRA